MGGPDPWRIRKGSRNPLDFVGPKVEKIDRKEERLFLAMARIDLDEAERNAIDRDLRGGPDWDRVVDLARRHDVTPFRYHHLRRVASDGLLPAGLFASLEKVYHANAYRNVKHLESLGVVLRALRDAGIDTIVLKGSALLDRIYRGIPLRTMADIDLLLPRGEGCDRAKAILIELGYRYHPSEASFWIGEDSRFRIEVLSGIMADHLSFFGHETGRLWERAEGTRIAGVETLVLASEDFLLHLCVHATYRHFFKLKFFVDIAEFVKAHGPALRWEELLLWDGKHPVGNHVYTALSTASRLLGAPVPESVLAEMRRQSPPALTRHLDAVDPSAFLHAVGGGRPPVGPPLPDGLDEHPRAGTIPEEDPGPPEEPHVQSLRRDGVSLEALSQLSPPSGSPGPERLPPGAALPSAQIMTPPRTGSTRFGE